MKRPTIVVGALIVTLSLSGCGDDSRAVNAGDDSSGGPVSSPEDFCVRDEDPTDYNAAHAAVEQKQSALQDDVERIRVYGEMHTNEFASAGFDNYPKVVSVGYFTGNLEGHRAALLPTVEHDDAFEVRLAVQSAAAAERIRGEWEAEGSSIGPRRSVLYDRANGSLEIDLAPTKAGRAAARLVEERWGDVACILLAGHPYPRGAAPDAPVQCPNVDTMPTKRNSNVDFLITLDRPSVARGERGTGVARITNRGSTRIEAGTGSDVTGFVIESETNRLVGFRTGPMNAMASVIRAEPGETIEKPFVFGTDDCHADADYATPAGEYLVTVSLGEFGRSNDAAVTVTEE
jgi:hypothetical protein